LLVQTPLTFVPVAVLLLVCTYRDRTAGVARRFENDPIPPAGTRRKQAVVADLMSARGRDQRCKTLEEFVALHQDMGRTVAPACLEAVREESVLDRFEALERERWTGDIATQPLESLAITGRHGHIGM